ncbi:hypothetical protein JQK19_20695 [Chromobacterium violaceum]|uniref:hypothetical protein n=1 Tax=Chromobacterium violaceum TaxID=536 RepID=UPI001BECCAC0|nr:hypothetical protein [Chromobacterium violaceum]MBT2869652.1 hypothetical protein [Chromobacterium violaceum]
MNDVTRFLRGIGLQPVDQGFLDSEFIMGQCVRTSQFTLVYRQEKERLLLCDFASAGMDGQAVAALLALLRRVARGVPALRYIDAMILPAPYDPELDRARRRLAELMLAEGARPIRLDDELWLRYSCA